MKRHNNWQEWGKRRTQQFADQQGIYRVMNEALEEFFSEWERKRELSGLTFESCREMYKPFHGGDTMRVPFHYANKDA